MDRLSPASPPVIASSPASVLRTRVSAFDDRFGGGGRGEFTSSPRPTTPT
ncbi:MAG: hypothetical protein V4850_01435 [Myxococcota bacterium]